MKKQQIKKLSIQLIFSLLLMGCEKDHPKVDILSEDIVNRFFEYAILKSDWQTPKTDFSIYSIETLRAYNEEVNFIPDFVNELGFADWNNTRYFETNDETVLQIPVYSYYDVEVKALIIVAKNEDKLSCYVIRRNCFDEFADNIRPQLTLSKVIDLFILADFKVFGKSNFLPNGNVHFDNYNNENTRLKGSIVSVEKCYYLEVFSHDWILLDARWECETSYEYYSNFKMSFEDIEGGGGGFGGFSGGSSAGGSLTPKKYIPNPNDKIAKPNFKSTMSKQLPNTCVTSIMDYIDDILCGNRSNEGDYMLDYLKWKNTFVLRDGGAIGDIVEFVNRHFNTNEFISYKNAIDKGCVILTCIKSPTDNSVHNVLIIGYRDGNSSNYIYMDPEKGYLQEASASYFLNLYNISVSSCK